MDNKTLWNQYKNLHSPEIKKQIMSNYINLVHYVIHNSRFMYLNVVEDKDYIQFGMEGLSEAVDRFQPDYGTKFETYAIQRIRGKIIDEIRKLQIKPRNLNAGNNDAKYRNISLHQPIENEDGYVLSDVIPSDSPQPADLLEFKEKKEILMDAIKNLSERERLIISLYYFEDLNYKEIAEILNITVSRISQVHTKIMDDLKSSIEMHYS